MSSGGFEFGAAGPSLVRTPLAVDADLLGILVRAVLAQRGWVNEQR